MGLSTFANFEGPDIFAFVVCVVLGYCIGTLMPVGAPAIYTTVLVSYHSFLAWLIFLRTGDKKAGVSLPIGQTILTHAACLAVILAPIITAITHHSIPLPGDVPADSTDFIAARMNSMAKQREAYHLFQALCSTMAGLAIFERKWLFSSEKDEPLRPQQPAPAVAAPNLPSATADEAAEWHRYLATRKPGATAPGVSLKAEYEQWLRARRKSQA